MREGKGLNIEDLNTEITLTSEQMETKRSGYDVIKSEEKRRAEKLLDSGGGTLPLSDGAEVSPTLVESNEN